MRYQRKRVRIITLKLIKIKYLAFKCSRPNLNQRNDMRNEVGLRFGLANEGHHIMRSILTPGLLLRDT